LSLFKIVLIAICAQSAIRNLLESEDSVVERYEPVMDQSTPKLGRGQAALHRGGAVARGAGYVSFLILGSEERAENYDSNARTFASYVIEVQKDDGSGPYLIYRRYKQFHALAGKCKVSFFFSFFPSSVPLSSPRHKFTFLCVVSWTACGRVATKAYQQLVRTSQGRSQYCAG
jgi:hypothetical protein